ncbi:hypothetical protein [Bacillus sp. 165]|uniref:hypothetical protein n=1 Tax=Bacillus sp. 165 TaxID=1529117 RepID=UPI001FFE2049|nr:hypothetical protein [Bacillus sp. 165]
MDRFYLDAGTREAADDERINKEFLASNTAVFEMLKEKLPNIKFEIVEGAEHSYHSFRERVPSVFSFFVR